MNTNYATLLQHNTSSRSITSQKKNSANIQQSWPRAWSIIIRRNRTVPLSERTAKFYLALPVIWYVVPAHTSGYPADLCLTGLQISTNQRASRKCLWRSIYSRAFREREFTVLRNSGVLYLTVQHLSTFAYDTHGQVKDTRLLKLNVLFMLR